MTKYTPELLREMIITAESRSEDWEGNIFGYKERKRTQGTHGGSKQVKYKDRYESSYPTKVKKWLHTLNESLEEGELVAYADDDQDSASQLAEYDIESEQRVCSNVEMVSAKSSLDEADRNVWNDMVSHSEAVNDSEVNERYDEKLTSIDRRTWDDILQNSRLPDYESSSEVQEGETAISDVDQEKEFSVQVAESLSTENEHDSEDDEGSSCGEDDVAYSDIDNAESDEYAEDEVAKSSIAEHDGDENDGVAIARADTNEFDSDEGDLDDILDRHIIEYDIGDSKLDYDCDVEDIEPVGHVTDLVSVDDAGYDSGTDANKWDYLFDPNDEREAYDDQVTERQLAIPSNQLIGHIHPRDEEIRRTRDKKRTKLQAKRLMVAAARRSKLLNSGEQQQPERFEDYKVYSAFKTLHEDSRGRRGLRATDVKIPKNYRQAMRSKHAKLWREAMDMEIDALRAKEVLRQISRSEMPTDHRTINTMWVFAVKTDHLGYVVRFKARVVARGDKQRPGIDFKDTFSPVARMATFRMFIAVCIIRDMVIYQGDINTAYLNATLGIKQYLEEVEGYPCEDKGMIYVIDKALYGLRQSGREWNTEVNSWFIDYGFKQCETEPCLYFYDRDGIFAIVLLYVDDILCATKNAEFKQEMFERLDKNYGLKDQGLLNTYLGVQVEQTSDAIKIHQKKYCEEIIERFDFNQVAKKNVDLWKVKTDVNPSDIMTKPLASDRLEKLCAMIGLSKQQLSKVTD
ncbi:unnamed protein product [Peronospora effusa]|nr:unnamed protein product [Peronospora effusa]